MISNNILYIIFTLYLNSNDNENMIHLPYLDQKCVRGEGVVKKEEVPYTGAIASKKEKPFSHCKFNYTNDMYVCF